MKETQINKFNDIYRENFKFLNTILYTTYDVIEKYQRLLFNITEHEDSIPHSIGDDEIEAIQSKGDRFLSELYGLSRLDHPRGYDMYKIGDRIGLNEFETEHIVKNLSRAELIGHDKKTNEVCITPYGKMIKNGEINIGYAPVHS